MSAENNLVTYEDEFVLDQTRGYGPGVSRPFYRRLTSGHYFCMVCLERGESPETVQHNWQRHQRAVCKLG